MRESGGGRHAREARSGEGRKKEPLAASSEGATVAGLGFPLRDVDDRVLSRHRLLRLLGVNLSWGTLRLVQVYSSLLSHLEPSASVPIVI